MKIDITQWPSRNAWQLPSGHLAVRPGLRLCAFAAGGYEIIGCASVKVEETDEYWHYTLQRQTTANGSLQVIMLDDRFNEVIYASVSSAVRPPGLWVAGVLGEVLIGAPGINTLWGVIGSAAVPAIKVASDNEANTPAIQVPRGMCVRWANRVVVASGRTLYVSDPVAVDGGDPRTFTGVNTIARSGAIYGIHVARNGDLVLCQDDGVFSWPVDAAAAVAPIGEWRLACSHRTLNYNSTAMHKGRLYGLTRRGYSLIDVEGAQAVALDEPYSTRTVARIARDDWRRERMVEGPWGPIVSINGHFLMTDIDRGVASWWSMTHTSENNIIVGTLHTGEGEELLVTSRGIYRIFGNYDGNATTENGSAVEAQFHNIVESGPESAPVLRRLHWGTDSAVEPSVAIRATQHQDTRPEGANGLVIGTNSWGGGNKYETPKMRSVAVDFAGDRTDDNSIELEASRPLSRVARSIFVEEDSPAPDRE